MRQINSEEGIFSILRGENALLSDRLFLCYVISMKLSKDEIRRGLLTCFLFFISHNQHKILS